MPSLLTTDEIREHVETDLEDTALQMRIDEAEADIVRVAGPHAGPVTERFTPGPGDAYLFVSRPIDTGQPVTIVESGTTFTGEDEVTLTADDYEIEGLLQVRRREGGVWSSTSWSTRTAVTYTPVADTPRRKGVLVDLVKLIVAYQGVQSASLGDVSVNHVDYERERARILRRLKTLAGSFA